MSELQIKPWLSMWTRPRSTIEAVVAYRPTYRFWVLSGIIGWPAAIQVAQIYALSASFELPLILLMTVLAAPLLGALCITVVGGVVYFTGKLLGGKASFSEMKCAVSWSNITSIISVLSYVIVIAYFRGGWFCPGWVNIHVDRYMAYVLFCLFLLQIVFVVWTVYLLIQSVSQVQRFSVWRSAANVGMAGIFLWGIVQVLG